MFQPTSTQLHAFADIYLDPRNNNKDLHTLFAEQLCTDRQEAKVLALKIYYFSPLKVTEQPDYECRTN